MNKIILIIMCEGGNSIVIFFISFQRMTQLSKSLLSWFLYGDPKFWFLYTKAKLGQGRTMKHPKGKVLKLQDN